jgi:hypothetical protein
MGLSKYKTRLPCRDSAKVNGHMREASLAYAGQLLPSLAATKLRAIGTMLRDLPAVSPQDHCAMMNLHQGAGSSLHAMLPGRCHLQNAALATVVEDNGQSWSSSKPTTVDQ